VTARAANYPPAGYSVRIPDAIWCGALDTVREYGTRGYERGRRGSEALVLFGGVVAGDEMIVTGLYRLNHEPQGDRVVVTPAETRWLLRTLSARDEKLIGQLHSHRGHAGHSLGDDASATSFHQGFLSIVIPFFGRDVTTPMQCAVLEYRAGTFVDLDENEVACRVQIYAPVTSRAAGAEPAKGGARRWSAFVQRLKSIARRRP
jgi:hypothetical protein